VVEKIVEIVSKLLVSPVYAQVTDEPPRIEELFGPLENLLDLIMPIGAVIAVAMMIYGGYMWIISGGDPSRKQMAQGTLTWAVFGLVFLFLIRAILIFILDLFGV
jgi:hypothetical protein